jgi:hypothetical protein
MLHDTALPVLALPAHRSHVLSARPDAPVVPHREPGPRSLREGAARTLRRVAGWVEPRPATRSGMIGCQLH